MHRLFTLFFILVCFNVSAQTRWEYNLDDPNDIYKPRLIIDTVNCKHNVWQIGKPHKPVFDSAYSAPFVIITDTIVPYPAADTSVFIIVQPKFIKDRSCIQRLAFKYQLDIDSGDIARVELSIDSGKHWIDVMNTDTAYSFGWLIHKPRLDTSTIAWQDFYFDLSPIQNHTIWNKAGKIDAVFYRFTFISDSVQSTKDGWMIDDFSFEEYTEGIETLSAHQKTIIYPNPSDGNVKLITKPGDASKAAIDIYTPDGRKVYHQKSPASELYLDLPDGNYILNYTNADDYATQQITIKR